MGVKDLWTFLAPYCERRPLNELKGQVVAIDLSGWVCEGLNVVDYFIHPRQYLKICPVFILDGEAPELKYETISKRNEIQFRGAKPKSVKSKDEKIKTIKGRTRFNHVLKKCEDLLTCMGIKCIQAPGEAEAFCAYLNKMELVDAVISQDSDCFAYGARKVYRNFSISSQGSSAAQGGSVDIYDMDYISNFGQNKVITMALLSGCDYCDGVGGVGKDAVIKLFQRYKDEEILQRIKSWRENHSTYTSLEMKVDSKNICTSCGHMGRLASHTKSGCASCHKLKGCDSNLWKEERLSIKAELILRKKALAFELFPSQDIIDEFKNEIFEYPELNLDWGRPNFIKFLKNFCSLLQWTEIYGFKKFLPILTRWHLIHYKFQKESNHLIGIDFIKKKRVLRGITCFEIVWKDINNQLGGMIPDDQLNEYLRENSEELQGLWSTIEPTDLVESAYPTIVEDYLMSKRKKTVNKKSKKEGSGGGKCKNGSLHDMNSIFEATEEISKRILKKKIKAGKGLQKLDKFLVHQTPKNRKNINFISNNCSTPKASNISLDLEDQEENEFNFSEIIKGIICKTSPLREYGANKLLYDKVNYRSFDDMDIPTKRTASVFSPLRENKRLFLRKSFEVLSESCNYNSYFDKNISVEHIDYQKNDSIELRNSEIKNISFFFERNHNRDIDEFQKSLDLEYQNLSD